MRITCDTNILVRAAVRAAGPARAVLVEATLPPHSLVLSDRIVSELARVLRYERVQRLAKLSDDEITEFLDALTAVAEFTALPAVIPLVVTDQDDNVIVATAVAGQADVICTLDRHLRHPLVQAYCATYVIRVLTDVELLTELRAQ